MQYFRILILLSIHIGSRNLVSRQFSLLVREDYSFAIAKAAAKWFRTAVQAAIWEGAFRADSEIDAAGEIEILCVFLSDEHCKGVKSHFYTFSGWTSELRKTVDDSSRKVSEALAKLLEESSHAGFTREEQP